MPGIVLPELVWKNGDFLSYDDARIGLFNHTLNYASGGIDGLRYYLNEDRGELYGFRVDDHYDRLLTNAAIFFRYQFPYTAFDLRCATAELIRRLQLRENLYVRPIAFNDVDALGIRPPVFKPTIALLVTPFGAYYQDEGLRLITATWRRPKDTILPARGKLIAMYANSLFASLEAYERGAHDALILTDDNRIAECSGANIFLVKRQRDSEGLIDTKTLFTPPVTDSILPGITRDTIIRLASWLGYQTTERSLDRSEAWQADEVFLAGTACEVSPVIAVDNRMIGDGRPRPTAHIIRRLYAALVYNREPKYCGLSNEARKIFFQWQKRWLTPVYGKASA